ncbi:Nicotinate phosphoribosyltransferase pncB2 [Candidatus Magnetomoraceae bacterium gMMP-1]
MKNLKMQALSTDLYELTMASGYLDEQMFENATFSLFIRKFPPDRGYFIAAGLEQALDYLENFKFSQNDFEYLESVDLFSQKFLNYLEKLRFSGQVHALPEGTIFFPNEPLLEITGSIIEAQILESVLINIFGFSTLIASKASRCIHAAKGRSLVDFSFRRTQGIDAGLKVARSSYISGFTATSNVLAGKYYKIPISGTMAHSYVGSFTKEIEAFRSFSRSFPDNTVLLIDTYDTLDGTLNAVKIAREMKKIGRTLKGVRLDSGDMTDLSIKVRKILDDHGFPDVKIFASSGFDEFKISNSLKAGAKIDAFGVGTKMGVSADAPYGDIVYKMVRYDKRDIKKFSPGKITLAGKKQVFRKFDSEGRFVEDIIGTRDEKRNDAHGLMKPVMKNGKIISSHPSLDDIRDCFKKNFNALDDSYKLLKNPPVYPVRISRQLKKLQEKILL